jgi:hypothetical protein
MRAKARELARKLAAFGVPVSLIRILPNRKGVLIEARKTPNRSAVIRKAITRGRPLNPADFRPRVREIFVPYSAVDDDKAVRQTAREIKEFLRV